MHTFKQEIQHYAPIVTSEGDLKREDYRILIPYTPEDPDRLLKYAIRIAKETAGEVNILHIITVPHQTPLSAGVAFADTAKRSFEPLEKILDNENIPSHYLVRVSHDATEAILATIEEQRIDLLVTDFETLRHDRKLLTLMTSKVLAIKAENDTLELEPKPRHINVEEEKMREHHAIAEVEKRNMVVIYDGSGHLDVLLRATSWLEHSGMFRVITLISLVRRENDNDNATNLESGSVSMHQEYLTQLGVNLRQIALPEGSSRAADAILAAVSIFQPDIVIMGATVGNHSVFQNPDFLALLDQFNCPVVITRDFIIPGVQRAKTVIMRLLLR
jgi:basic amino acid/polyamine antiporter, APA family